LLMAVSLNDRHFSRIHALLLLVPCAILVNDLLLNGKKLVSISMLIASGVIIVSAFLIIIGEPKHSHKHLYDLNLVEKPKQRKQKKKKTSHGMQSLGEKKANEISQAI
jgi:hypothetical protein